MRLPWMGRSAIRPDGNRHPGLFWDASDQDRHPAEQVAATAGSGYNDGREKTYARAGRSSPKTENDVLSETTSEPLGEKG
jgi:hypothetical protein